LGMRLRSLYVQCLASSRLTSKEEKERKREVGREGEKGLRRWPEKERVTLAQEKRKEGKKDTTQRKTKRTSSKREMREFSVFL
jgi:hypothetical protein